MAAGDLLFYVDFDDYTVPGAGDAILPGDLVVTLDVDFYPDLGRVEPVGRVGAVEPVGRIGIVEAG